LPLLLIKPPHNKGVLRTSLAQAELGDIPVTISSILNMQQQFPGQSLFTIDPSTDRERKAYYSSTTHRNDAMVSGYFDTLQEYMITGNAFTLDSWEKGRLLTKKLQTYTWGSDLQFHKQGNVLPYLQSGWALPAENCIFNNGKSASFKIPISETENDVDMFKLKAKISPVLFPAASVDKQRVKIDVNGTPVGEWLLVSQGEQWNSVLFEKRVLSSSSFALVNFSFPDAVIPSQIGVGEDQRMLSVCFHTIALKIHLKPYKLGLPISFAKEGTSKDYILSGWGEQEENQRWTLGSEASITLKVDKKAYNTFMLRVIATPYLAHGKIDQQEIYVNINHQQTTKWIMHEEGTFELTFPASIIGKDGTINLKFEISNPSAPADFSNSTDSRKLGIAVRELLVDAVD